MDWLNKTLLYCILSFFVVHIGLLYSFRDDEMELNGKDVNNQLHSAMFTLEYLTVSGPELGEKLYQYQSYLKLDRKTGIAFLEKCRSSSDEPGEPIGTFRAKLTENMFRYVFEIVRRTKFDSLPPSTGGGIGASVMTLNFAQNDSISSIQFTSRDIQLIECLDELLVQLNKIVFDLEEHAESAIKIEVKYSGDSRFKITITNIGSQNICMSDPRALGHDDPECWAGVKIAELPEELPGYTSPPLQWSNLILTNQGVQEKYTVLKPGEVFSAYTETWTAKRNVRYIIQGIFSDYKGPSDTTEGYPVRGAVFSKAIELTVK